MFARLSAVMCCTRATFLPCARRSYALAPHDLVRAREDAKQDQQRARQRLGKFLLQRHGAQSIAYIEKKWTAKYLTWLHDHVHFEQPAFQATLADLRLRDPSYGRADRRSGKAIDDAIVRAPEQISFRRGGPASLAAALRR